LNIHNLKYVILHLLTLLGAAACFAQGDNFADTVYYDESWYKVKKKYAKYYRIPAVKNGDRYIASYYKMGGTPVRTGSVIPVRVDYHKSIEDGIGIMDGPWTFYDDIGIKSAEGQFRQNQKSGLWKYYYNDGISLLATEDYYDDQPICYTTFYYRQSEKKINEGILMKYIVAHEVSYEKAGPWIFYFKNSDVVKKVLNYDFGKLNGPCTYYYRKTGNIECKGKFSDDKRDSVWTYYDQQTGQLEGIITYKDGYREGPRKLYYVPSGKIALDAMYYGGKITGGYKTYYDSTELTKSEAYFRNGNAHMVYYDSASKQKSYEGDIQNHNRTGTWKKYYLGGNVSREENYFNDLLEGETVFYDNKGLVIARKQYQGGKINGKLYWYHEGSNTIWLEGDFENDSLNGKRLTYYPSGKLKRDEIVKKGAPVSGKCYEESGTETTCKDFSRHAKFKTDVMTYIGNNLHYPAEAKEAGIEGKVLVGFTVEKSGAIADVRIINSLEPSCDEEAIRLVSQMPPWEPTTIDNTPISDYQTLPIVFWKQEE
jgi:periplasmic protein TonB